MNPEAQTDVAALHAISDILIDQVRLYERASLVAGRPELELAISRARSARQELLGDVNGRIRELGDTPDIRGAALGASHKSLLKARGPVGKRSKAAIHDAERGEDRLCDQLGKHADDRALSEPTRTFFRELLVRARPVHEEIAFLKSR